MSKKGVAAAVSAKKEPEILASLDSINKSFNWKSDGEKNLRFAGENEKLKSVFFATYLKACKLYGNHGIEPEDFINHVFSAIEKKQESVTSPVEILEFLQTYYIDDLYLAYACSLGIDSAWESFVLNFSSDVKFFAKIFSRSLSINEEIADSIWTYLYLPSRNGRKRISNYDGRVSLTSWLRAVVFNYLVNQRKLKNNRIQSLDDVSDVSTTFEQQKIDSVMRFKRYGWFVSTSIEEACQELTNQECSLILLRYEKNQDLKHISHLFNIHQSTVMRRIEKICWRIRQKVKTNLIMKYKLNESVVKECISDLVENSNYSIISKIRESRGETALKR